MHGRRLIPPLGFRDYILLRKYDLGSRGRSSWPFVMHVLAEPDLPPIATLGELAHYLREAGVPAEVAKAARSAWKSFSAYKSRHRLGRAGDGTGVVRAMAGARPGA